MLCSVLMSPEQGYYNLRIMRTESRKMTAFIIICAAAGGMVTILRNKVVVFYFDCYHRKGYNVKTLCHGVGAEIKLWSGRFLLFLLVTIQYDSTRSLRIKQSDGKCVRFSYGGTSFILHEKLK